MKIIVFLFLVCLSLSRKHVSIKEWSHSHKLRRFKTISQMHLKEIINPLKTIRPQMNGGQLSNHFGYKPQDSPYGPQPDQINLDTLQIKNRAGVWTKPINNNLGVLDIIGDNCDVKQNPYYEHCKAIDNCQLCQANDNICNWCESDKKCNPYMCQQNCANVCPFQLESSKCANDHRIFGEITNVASGSRGMVSPEIDLTPKYMKHTHTLEIVPSQSHIKIGYSNQRVKMSYKKVGPNREYNQLVNEYTDVQSPVYMSLKHNKIMDTHHHHVYNAQTNKQIHEQAHQEQKVMHGV